MTDREFDVVLHGASGFVGRLTARELAEHGSGARVALSGRSAERVEAVRRELGVDWPVLETDSADPAAVRALAARTRVVATAVGPYARYGMPLLEACAAVGTGYCDLTGEVLFVQDSLRLDEEARRTGARIVPSTGFDSVPSDLGVLLLHERVQRDGEGGLAEVVTAALGRGGFSGGTIDSGRAEAERLDSEPALGAVFADPYALSPDRGADPAGEDERDRTRMEYDPFLGAWTAPFVMGPYNARVVRRSNALAGHAYGRGLRYREVVATGRGPGAAVVAGALTLGQGALVAGMRRPRVRSALDRVLPKPGSGPSERTRAAGWFALRIHAVTTSGAAYLAEVSARADPGYGATAVMFGQSALSLAVDPLTSPGGVLTPATAMGDHLVARLRDRGFVLRVRRARRGGRPFRS